MRGIRLTAILMAMLICGLVGAMAQSKVKRSNYIYIFDCTKSMIRYNILDRTLQFVHDDISERSPGNEITVVLFQGQPLETMHFMREDFNDSKWAEIDKLVRGHADVVTNTNIVSAWERGLDFIDEGKYNYIYLMTDGEDNAHGGRGTAEVCRLIREWCGKFRDSRAYYVELYDGAINDEIKRAIEESCNITAIRSDYHDHFMSFDKQEITVNTRELNQTVRLHSDWSRETPLSVQSNDPYFTVTVEGDKLLEGGVADFRVSPLVSLQDFSDSIDHAPEYRFTVTLTTSRQDLGIQNPVMEVVVINKPERILSTPVTDGADLGCAHYYPSFLFWGESELDTLTLDLKMVFNEDAKRQGAMLKMQVTSDLEGDGYTLLYNGRAQEDKTFTVSKDDATSLLQIVFNRDAQDGDRNFVVKTVEGIQLDRVNQSVPQEYILTLEAEYDIDWNPLQTIIFWAVIVFIGLLVLWFCMIKPVAYPKFRGVNRLTLTNEREAYYQTVPAKGYREIVLCNKAEKQGWIDKTFRGKKRYEVDERWDHPVVISPNGKGIRVNAGANYLLDKFTCDAGDYLEIESLSRNSKVTMEVN